MNACTQPDLMAAVRACLDYAKAGLYRTTADVADAITVAINRLVAVRHQLSEGVEK